MKVLLFSLSLTAILSVASGVVFAEPIIATPQGLLTGDHFRIMFVTTGHIDALSSDIDTYNSFVNADANGATYQGQIVTWKAIGSTDSISAIDNIGVTGDPVYIPGGIEIAPTDDKFGLWSGLLLFYPNAYLNGLNANESPWSGTSSDGTSLYAFDATLGSPNQFALYGNSGQRNDAWINSAYDLTYAKHAMYAISGDLVVSAAAVPEPSTAALAGFGGILALAYSSRRNQPQLR